MAERHRLGGLQMGEARHDGVGMRLSLVEERLDQAGHQRFGLGQLRLDPEAEIHRHLVVARAAGMQAAGGGADQFGQPRFHIHVDVFKFA